MKPIVCLFIASFLFCAAPILADVSIPASATTQPSFIVIDKLDEYLQVRQQAKTFAALVELTKPKLTWGGRDMVWIMHDSSGKPVFAMDRAYDLQIGKQESACYLLESHGYWDDPERPDLLYTYVVDAHPGVVARDPVRGVIYQAHWDSAPESGSGGWTQTRNLFLLCDGEHRWHLLGEGPIGSRDQCGYDEHFDDAVEATAQWTADAAHPVKLSFTLLTTDSWNYDGEKFHESMTARREMVPGAPNTGGIPEGRDAADVAPGLFIRQGPYYVIASRDESLNAFVQWVFHNQLPSRKNKEQPETFIHSVKTSLGQTNPALTADVVKGEKIVLPEKLWHGDE